MIRLTRPIAAAAAIAAAYAMAGAAHAQYSKAGPEQLAVMSRTPDLDLPGGVIEAAAAYRTYMRSVADSPSAFGGGVEVAKSVRAGAAYEPQQLARGAVAYAAVVALQNPTFHRAIRAAAADPFRRRELAARIWEDPQAATQLQGAEQAAGLILAAVGSEGARLRDRGEQVRRASYSVQLQPWSKLEISERDHRLAEAKVLSQTPLIAPDGELASLRAAVVGESPLPLLHADSAESYAPVVIRGLATAALMGLGEAGPDNAERLDALMADPACAECLRMSKLNLFQCLAVAMPWFEDLYCVGQHGLKDTGECIYAASREPRDTYADIRRATPPRRRDSDWRMQWRSDESWSRF